MAKIHFLASPIIWLILVVSLLFIPKKAFAFDNRVLKVSKFLQNQNSPLVHFAPDFVASADKYQIDYRLLVAISGTESTFGKYYIYGTYNAYGWGVGKIQFKSWPDGIDKISKSLKEKYINKGADDIYKIGRIYCPPTSFHWSTTTESFMKKIESTDISGYNLSSSKELANLPLTI